MKNRTNLSINTSLTCAISIDFSLENVGKKKLLLEKKFNVESHNS